MDIFDSNSHHMHRLSSFVSVCPSVYLSACTPVCIVHGIPFTCLYSIYWQCRPIYRFRCLNNLYVVKPMVHVHVRSHMCRGICIYLVFIIYVHIESIMHVMYTFIL